MQRFQSRPFSINAPVVRLALLLFLASSCPSQLFAADAATVLKAAQDVHLDWHKDVSDLMFQRVEGVEARTRWPDHLLQPFGWREPAPAVHLSEEPWSLHVLEMPAHKTAWLWFDNGEPVMSYGRHFQRQAEHEHKAYRLTLGRGGRTRLEGFVLRPDAATHDPARLIAVMRAAMQRQLWLEQIEQLLDGVEQLYEQEIVDPAWLPWLTRLAQGRIQVWLLETRTVPAAQTDDRLTHHYYTARRVAGTDNNLLAVRARAAGLAYHLAEQPDDRLLAMLADSPDGAMACIEALFTLRQHGSITIQSQFMRRIVDAGVRDYAGRAEVAGRQARIFRQHLLARTARIDPAAGTLLALHMLDGSDEARDAALRFMRDTRRRGGAVAGHQRDEGITVDTDAAIRVVRATGDPYMQWIGCWLVLREVAASEAFQIKLHIFLTQHHGDVASRDGGGGRATTRQSPVQGVMSGFPSIAGGGPYLLGRALQLDDQAAYQRLIAAGVTLPERDDRVLSTLLQAIAESEGTEAFDRLLEATGGDDSPISHYVASHRQAGIIVARGGNRELLERLRDDWDQDILRAPLLREALNYGQVELAQWLLDEGSDLTRLRDERRNVMHTAAMNGHIESVRLLLEQGWPVDSGSNWVAIERDERNIQRRVPTDRKQTPLYDALTARQFDMARFLIEQGADIRHAERLFGEQEDPREALFDFLIEHGADPDGVHSQGSTWLFDAVRRQDVWHVQALLKAGADPHATNPADQTAAAWLKANIRIETEESRTILELLGQHAADQAP